MPATLTTVSEILKEVYEPKIQEQLNDEAVALRRIERSSDGVTSEVGGKYVTFPIHLRRNQGIGARNEMEALPTPGQQGYAASRVRLTYQYGSARFSGQTLKLADGNPKSFASVLDEEMTGLKDDLAVDQNRQIYGDSVGTIATATGANTGNVIPVEWAGWLQDGMMIDVIDSDGSTVNASNRQVVDVDPDANTFTISGAAVVTAAGDFVVRTGNINREWHGFGSIISATSELQDIDPAVERRWKGVVDDNSGTNRPLSEGLMTLMADKIRTNGGRVTAIFSNLGVRRAYANLLTQQRRFTNTTEFTGGFSGLAFTTDKGDIPFVVDTMAPLNRAYFVNEKKITVYRENDWAFMDEDGSKFSRVAGYDAYDVTMFQYSELGTHQRNTHGILDDITEG